MLFLFSGNRYFCWFIRLGGCPFLSLVFYVFGHMPLARGFIILRYDGSIVVNVVVILFLLIKNVLPHIC
jgi:hypothetical protein